MGVTLRAAFMPSAFDALSDEDLFHARSGATDRERALIEELLVRRHVGLVRWLAGRYVNPAVDRDELEAVGFTGLALAIKRFDPQRGSDFTSFARPTVQGEIRRYFRDKRRWIRLPRRLQEIKARLRDATEDLTGELGRNPTVAELAHRLAVDEEFVLEAITADDAWAPASLDAPVGGDDSDSWTLAESLGEPDERLQTIVDSTSLKPLLAALSPREQRILHLRFFDDMTQAQIGEEVGLSQMHVSRILTKVLTDLREQINRD
jgi:RNA polymerase sigma-B factor